MLYKYLYIDKLAREEKESGDLKFGTAIHLGLEVILSKQGNGLDDFNLFWDLEKNKDNQYSRNDWAALKEQGEKLLTRFERLHAKKFKPVAQEQLLKGQFGSIKLFGTPDFIGEYEGVPSVIDFKTAGYRYEEQKLVLSEQLYLYAFLAKQVLGYDVKQLVYKVFIKGNEPSIQTLKVDLDPLVMIKILDNIHLQALELDQKEKHNTFTKNPVNCSGGKCAFPERCYGLKKV